METSRISIRLSGVDLELTAELAIDVVSRLVSFQE